MAAISLIYNTFMRRNAVFVGTIFAGAFAFEMGFDTYIDKYFDSRNAGKQWKDIKYKYVTKEDEE
ncbi:ubiquinol-cytochrome c reductase [Lipomyces arxii]|uniref:ubiquinol-cytochrome c reductase n=1 Tax=Lipomyces arxii TaxID=56418 RepID=UPI0034CE5A1A